MDTDPKFIEAAKTVLANNDRGQWTIPAHGLYPHQWLWDSCFIAIGLRHYNPQRAATELKSLFRGQWRNGMLPHIVINPNARHWADESFWKSQDADGAPAGQPTSGMTQPPMVAIAALAVAQKLPQAEAQVFLKSLYPKILAYHNWIYQERVPSNAGLAVLIHPWETGLDNSPGWQKLIKKFSPLWVTTFLSLGLSKLVERFRRDTKEVPSSQRLTYEEAVKLLALSFYARRRHYDSKKIIRQSRFTVESLIFNCILIAANRALGQIAQIISEDIPAGLSLGFGQTVSGLESLWDVQDMQYHPRAYKSQKLLGASITTFLPLYAGSISRERAAQLVSLLKDSKQYWPDFPVPSVSIASSDFDEDRYWKGPAWINMNWLIVQGLLNYGYDKEARDLYSRSRAMVGKSGFHEYFSAFSGEGYGSNDFSWSAALFLDLALDGRLSGGSESAAEPMVNEQTNNT